MIDVYEELADCSRRSILGELRTGPKCVKDLVIATGLKQPNVSNHLNRMRSKDVVRAEKLGRQVFYSFASTDVEEIVNTVFSGRNPCHLSTELDHLQRSYATSAIQSDEGACCEMIDCLLKEGANLVTIYSKLLAPAMSLIGQWYLDGEICEAKEHIASEITFRMMAKVVQASGCVRRTGKTSVLGCVQGSHHSMGLRMVADYLKVLGWRTIYLGADVPLPAFLATVREYLPDLVLISCVAEESLAPSRALVKALAEDERYVIGIGGHAALNHLTELRSDGIDLWAECLNDFTQKLARSFPQACGK